MSYYILDTDHVSLYQRGHVPLGERLTSTPEEQIALTIITVEEQLRGRLANIRKATTASEYIQAYAWLHETLDFFSQFTILDFDEDAAAIFGTLKQQKIRVGTQDLRIAAIVLIKDGILLTRNRRDFTKVSGLTIEDWTLP